MAVYDAAGYAGDLFGWRSELGARIQDSLARKAIPVTARLGAIVRRIESAVSMASLKSAVGELVRYFRREAIEDRGAAGPERELEILFRRIAEHGSRGTIEDYTAYLFTVSIDL